MCGGILLLFIEIKVIVCSWLFGDYQVSDDTTEQSVRNVSGVAVVVRLCEVV
jgi:hypothetical protein